MGRLSMPLRSLWFLPHLVGTADFPYNRSGSFADLAHLPESPIPVKSNFALLRPPIRFCHAPGCGDRPVLVSFDKGAGRIILSATARSVFQSGTEGSCYCFSGAQSGRSYRLTGTRFGSMNGITAFKPRVRSLVPINGSVRLLLGTPCCSWSAWSSWLCSCRDAPLAARCRFRLRSNAGSPGTCDRHCQPESQSRAS